MAKLLRRTIGPVGWTAFGVVAGYSIWARKSKVTPIAPDDYIFGNTLIARFNPNNSPIYSDICRRRVPIDKIDPELLGPQNEGKLVERFSAGLWGGMGYAFQRRYLERKYRSPKTAYQLWDQTDLANSSYDLGTVVTDHFEVVSKTPESIIMRCGDTPLRSEVRESDGLFELVAETKEEEGVVEFGLKSVFFNGLAESGTVGVPMSGVIAWLHKQYDRILMETAIKRCMK